MRSTESTPKPQPKLTVEDRRKALRASAARLWSLTDFEAVRGKISVDDFIDGYVITIAHCVALFGWDPAKVTARFTERMAEEIKIAKETK